MPNARRGRGGRGRGGRGRGGRGGAVYNASVPVDEWSIQGATTAKETDNVSEPWNIKVN